MRWTCQGKSALLSSSQRYRGPVQLWSQKTWTQTWKVRKCSDLEKVKRIKKNKSKKNNCWLMIDPAKLVWRIIEFSMLCINPSVRSRHGKQSWAIHIFMFSARRHPSTEQCHWHSTCRYLPILIIWLYIIFSSVFPQFPLFQSENEMKCSCFAGMQCIPQRAALLKSMLNFLKKAIQDPAFSDGIRHGELLWSSGFDWFIFILIKPVDSLSTHFS